MAVATAPASLVRARRDRATLVEVPERCYLAVDGCERPGGQTYRNAIATLLPIASALQSRVRRAGIHAPLGTLEALYWLAPEEVVDEHWDGHPLEHAGAWSWRLLIAIPEATTEEDIEAAVREAAARRTQPAISRFHVVRWQEGPSAQILHVGRYSAEDPTTATLAAAIAEAGLEPHGPHHEIYLNDPSRAGEAKARTIIRRAVRPRRATANEGRP